VEIVVVIAVIHIFKMEVVFPVILLFMEVDLI
jgi:hypothetical protein